MALSSSISSRPTVGRSSSRPFSLAVQPLPGVFFCDLPRLNGVAYRAVGRLIVSTEKPVEVPEHSISLHCLDHGSTFLYSQCTHSRRLLFSFLTSAAYA